MTDRFAACRDEDRLSRDLADVLNRHSCENGSDTPDFARLNRDTDDVLLARLFTEGKL